MSRFKILSVVMSAFLFIPMFAQGSRPSVAVMEPKSNAKVTEINRMSARAKMGEYLTDSRKYRVLDRANIDQILKEHGFGRSEYVDASKAKEVGKILQADYICTIEFHKDDNAFMAIASLIDVVSGEVERTGNEIIASDSPLEIHKAMEKIALKLAGSAAPAGTGATQQRGATRSVPANFVLISGGTFTMGSPGDEAERNDNEIPHQVTVSSFYMGKYQVTQAEYQELIGTNPSFFKVNNRPVENVSWFDAVFYCNRLSQREGLTSAYTISGENVTWNRSANGYRLPTEAEWEYACRAGTTTPFSTGYNITTDQANYDGNYPYNNNVKGRFREQTTPVGSFASNPWGLYDMHGNVLEWCWDWYGTYSVAPQTDPVGASSGTFRVIRGGSWFINGRIVRSAYRDDVTPSSRYCDVGFRVVRPHY